MDENQKPKFRPPQKQLGSRSATTDRTHPQMKTRDQRSDSGEPRERFPKRGTTDRAERVPELRTHESAFLFVAEHNGRRLLINVGREAFSVIDVEKRERVARFASERPFPQNLIFDASIGTLYAATGHSAPCLFLCYCGQISVHFFDKFEVENVWRACPAPRLVRYAGGVTCFVSGDVVFQLDGTPGFTTNVIEAASADGASLFQYRIQGRINCIDVNVADGFLRLTALYQTPTALILTEQAVALPNAHDTFSAQDLMVAPTDAASVYGFGCKKDKETAFGAKGASTYQHDTSALCYRSSTELLNDRYTAFNALLAGQDLMFVLKSHVLLAQRGMPYLYMLNYLTGEVRAIPTYLIAFAYGAPLQALWRVSATRFLCLLGGRAYFFELLYKDTEFPDVSSVFPLRCDRATNLAVSEDVRTICAVSAVYTAQTGQPTRARLIPERDCWCVAFVSPTARADLTRRLENYGATDQSKQPDQPERRENTRFSKFARSPQNGRADDAFQGEEGFQQGSHEFRYRRRNSGYGDGDSNANEAENGARAQYYKRGGRFERQNENADYQYDNAESGERGPRFPRARRDQTTRQNNQSQ